MKKHTLTLTALTLAAALLAGCSKPDTSNPSQDSDLSTTQSTSTTTESTTEPTISESIPETVEKGRFVYGEKEIPNITYPEYKETDGRYIAPMAEGRAHGLESMVFETHTFKDYTVSLVGSYVRTDKEHFPGTIFTQELHIEIEKDGKRLSDEFADSVNYTHPYGRMDTREFLIYEDQIGDYLDIYDMKNPVIAMRYFGREDLEESFRKIVEFTWIEDNTFVGGFLGNFAENTGAIVGGGDSLQFYSGGQYAIFAADEFKIENENTIVDEEAGIKYIFDFDKTDDTGHYYSTEKIG
ncbi:MAG: hypothetical protein K2N06_01615 [Oscillospiraceae bacterium]|nr:hypothetical protein [Oscillospiraceae bacterium]